MSDTQQPDGHESSSHSSRETSGEMSVSTTAAPEPAAKRRRWLPYAILAGVFLAGFLAICAMILPGISGSFILVLLGMYGPTLLAVKALDVGYLSLLVLGAVCGLLVFSRLLHWLLQRFHAATMALLTGFLFGSLLVVWPWKRVLAWVEGSSGGLKPAQQLPVGQR